VQLHITLIRLSCQLCAVAVDPIRLTEVCEEKDST